VEIESIIRRKNGTKVQIDDKEYFFFSAVADGPHVATVDNDAHAQRLLSITEGYRIHRAAAKPPKADDSVGNDIDPEQDEPLEGDLNGDGSVDGKDERIALVAAYEAKFGKKPHYKMGLEKLRESLE
jgi:hypothetical protein